MLARFVKMHGCGNDFVVFDERSAPLGLTPARVAAIANRRTGIGCDQLITVETPPPGGRNALADAFMRIRNPDGTEAGACGNATRCVAALLSRETGRRHLVIRTVAGDLHAELLADGRVLVDMGQPRLDWPDIPLGRKMDTLHLDLALGPVEDPAAASMGNPHVTFFVASLAALPVEELGPALERHPLFPDRANIGFAEVLGRDRIRLRLWERGAGLTLACGSGACAALVNAHRRGLTGRRAAVILDGGELEIEWRENGPPGEATGRPKGQAGGQVVDRAGQNSEGGPSGGSVLMTGPVATAFTGEIDLAAYPA
jgi:diaminopimelate epimerase